MRSTKKIKITKTNLAFLTSIFFVFYHITFYNSKNIIKMIFKNCQRWWSTYNRAQLVLQPPRKRVGKRCNDDGKMPSVFNVTNNLRQVRDKHSSPHLLMIEISHFFNSSKAPLEDDANANHKVLNFQVEPSGQGSS